VNENRQVEGTVRHRMSEGPDADRCICCPGPHKYGSYIEGVPNTGGEWVYRQIRDMPDGAKVRISLEVIE